MVRRERERERERKRARERERERECARERQGFMTRSTETINIARRDKGCPFVPNINHLSTGCNDKKHENITMSKNDLLQVRRQDNSIEKKVTNRVVSSPSSCLCNCITGPSLARPSGRPEWEGLRVSGRGLW